MRRPRTVLVCVVLVGVATGCSGGSQGSRVLVIGDSITAMSEASVTTALEGSGWQPTVAAEGGTDIAHWRGRARDYVRIARPDVAIIELGTNQRGDETRVRRLVDQVMHDLRKVPAVYWLNVQRGIRVDGTALPPDAEGVNRALAEAQIRWPNLHVVDFDGYFTHHSEWHTADGVHPNPRGQAAYARLLAKTIGPADTPSR